MTRAHLPPSSSPHADVTSHMVVLRICSLTQSMALELGKQGILCNAIAPGTIATEGTAQLWGKVTVGEDGKAQHDTETEREASGTCVPCLLTIPPLLVPRERVA